MVAIIHHSLCVLQEYISCAQSKLCVQLEEARLGAHPVKILDTRLDLNSLRVICLGMYLLGLRIFCMLRLVLWLVVWIVFLSYHL